MAFADPSARRLPQRDAARLRDSATHRIRAAHRGFISQIVPAEVIGHFIGYESGLEGILDWRARRRGPHRPLPDRARPAASAGGFPQVMVYLTAWSVFAFNRVIIYEVPLMGSRFVMISAQRRGHARPNRRSRNAGG